MRQLNRSTIGDALAATRQPFHDGYFAMYSSVLDAVVTDPTLMMVPIDDHMVHRGDAVFETFKCINGQIYNLAAHLDRLIESAEMIALVSPLANAEVTRLIIETIRAARQPDCLIRLLLSRGPGSLGVNPFDCPRPGLYIVATRLSQPFMALHPDGAHVAISKLGGKANFFAQTKNCNYLLNALVKKEAVDAGVDFMAMCDGAGHLMEGATENMGIVSADGVLAFPRLDGILRGTTMMRVCELAKDLVDDGT
ncbi:MAG: aminotransferase class IV, partial [Verrucomicrobia bacterium]|nr:aminotransferase class IV [Verrucomicrobiota bacterium]